MTTENKTPSTGGGRSSRTRPTATVEPQEEVLPFEDLNGEDGMSDEMTNGMEAGQPQQAAFGAEQGPEPVNSNGNGNGNGSAGALATLANGNNGAGELAEYQPTGYVALDMAAADSSFLEAISENLGEEGITRSDLEHIKLPAGGNRYWTIETPEGQDTTPEIQGIIIYKQTIRGYWAKSIEEGGGSMPPDCSSEDGVTGTVYGDCKTCHLNQFGSSRTSRGKACQEKQLLYVLVEDRILPIIIQVPATSLKSVHQYMVSLIGSKNPRPYWQVVTSFKLITIKGDPFTYAQIVAQSEGFLDANQVEQLRAFRKDLTPKLKQFSRTNLQELVLESDSEDEDDMHGDDMYGDGETGEDREPVAAGAVIDQDGNQV